MTYKMRRMMLVNLGTNLRTPSGRIAEIDPRGGAAVVGANGVGKTTTLRLIPLFFGHLPGQIVASGHGQEAMIRFVLPTPQSAIVFEYQRGPSEEHDIRCAVIRRRQDGGDAPEYRFFYSAFRQELFTSGEYFLGDEGSIAAARSLGIPVTQKLSAPDYRAVILGLRPMTKDAMKLRRLSMDYAFGPKPLPNLDRLVAAMVKSHINFGDLVQVVVGMVQEELGTSVSIGRNKLSLKQSKAQIAQWLIDREACSDANKLESRFQAFKDKMEQYHRQEMVLREMRADVRAVKTARETEKIRLEASLNSVRTLQQEQQQEEDRKRAQVDTESVAAQKAWVDSDLAYKKQKATQDSLETEQASTWESQQQLLPSLKVEFDAYRSQIDIVEGKTRDLNADYEKQVSNVQCEALEKQNELEKSKEKPRERADAEITALADQEHDAIEAMSEIAKNELTALSAQMSDLQEEQGRWKQLFHSPQVSNELKLAVEDTSTKCIENLRILSNAHEKKTVFSRSAIQAHEAFHKAEDAERSTIHKLEDAQVALLKAQQSLSPANNTLLSVLREQASTDWKHTLAKVINPELLQRTDLAPHIIEECDGIYGWSVNLHSIDAVDWTNDEHLHSEILRCDTNVNSAIEHRRAALDAFSSVSNHLKQAQTDLSEHEARISVLEAQRDTLTEALSLAKERHEADLKEVKNKAEAELKRIFDALKIVQTKQTSLVEKEIKDRIAIQNKYNIEKKASKKRQEEAITSISHQIAHLNSETKKRISELHIQRDQHLSEQGIDVGKLRQLKQEFNELKEKIRLIEDKKSLVMQWKTWLAEGGYTLVAKLEQEKQVKKTDLDLINQKREKLLKDCEELRKKHDNTIKIIRDRQIQVDEEIQIVTHLDDDFDGYTPRYATTIDTAISATQLRTRVYQAKQKLREIEQSITAEFSSLKSTLCARDSAVKEFVDASLLQCQDHKWMSQSHELVTCYQRIGSQIINNVNTTLKAVLDSIGLFYQGIQSFESEVKRFNGKLQKGLESVTLFERVRDFKIDVVTNFNDIEFMKKLDMVNNMIRQHRSEIGRDPRRDLPSEEAAHALREFAGVIGSDGSLEVNLASHVSLKGSVTENGVVKTFRRESELEHISSNGLTSIILITLLSGLLNMIRGSDDVHVAWVTDEVGKFDGANFAALMQLLKDNRIDVVTASPDLSVTQYRRFARRYQFADKGVIRIYALPEHKGKNKEKKPNDTLTVTEEPA